MDISTGKDTLEKQMSRSDKQNSALEDLKDEKSVYKKYMRVSINIEDFFVSSIWSVEF